MLNMEMKNNIPTLLKSSGLTISKLQRRADVSYPTAHGLCTAEIMPNVELATLSKIAKVLKCSIFDLFEDNNAN